MAIIPRERLERVQALYLRGHTEGEIQRTVAAECGVTTRQVRTYLARVKAKLAAAARDADPDVMRAQIIGQLDHAYRVAEIGGAETGPNANAMVNAATRKAEVLGLMAPKRFEHTGTVSFDANALNDRLTAFLSGPALEAGPGAAAALPAEGERGDAGGDRGGAGEG